MKYNLLDKKVQLISLLCKPLFWVIFFYLSIILFIGKNSAINLSFLSKSYFVLYFYQNIEQKSTRVSRYTKMQFIRKMCLLNFTFCESIFFLFFAWKAVTNLYVIGSTPLKSRCTSIFPTNGFLYCALLRSTQALKDKDKKWVNSTNLISNCLISNSTVRYADRHN